MEQKTFKFTVEISKDTYVQLREESKKREGSKGAVPSRTARQLIEERLEELAADNPTPPKPAWIGDVAAKDQPTPKVKKQKSGKRGVGADESTPT